MEFKCSGATSGTIVGVNTEGKNQSTTKTYKITPSKEEKYIVYLKGDITDANEKTSDINKVETELTKLKADQESQKYDDCINEIETTKFILRHIEDKEKFTIQSIF